MGQDGLLCQQGSCVFYAEIERQGCEARFGGSLVRCLLSWREEACLIEQAVELNAYPISNFCYMTVQMVTRTDRQSTISIVSPEVPVSERALIGLCWFL